MPKQHPHPVNPDMTLTPEEMKAIGEIELGPSRHERFLNHHYKKLIVATLALMILSAAAIVYGTFRARQEADSSAKLLGALNVIPDANSAPSDTFNLTALEQIISAYPDTQAAATASLLRGMQLVSGGEEKSGVDALQQLIATTDNADLRLRAQVFLAGHSMSGGNSEEAEKLWQDVARSGQSTYLAVALLSLGDIARQKGDTEQARLFYTRISSECPGTSLLPAVQQRLLTLGVDAPRPVSPQPAPAQNVEIPTWHGLSSPDNSSH